MSFKELMMRYWALVSLILTTSALAQFTNESELSLVQTGGNSEVQTNNAKTTNVYQWTRNSLRFGGRYTYGETENGVSARNWDINARFERILSPKISATLGGVIEGNTFIGLQTRYNSDAGLKYYHVKSDMKNIITELGYRYTIEDRVAPIENTYDNKGRLYNEINHKISETVQYKVWLEFVPNFTESEDYLINGEASITSILNSVFSLRVAYLGMYDNLPAFSGFKNYDYTTTTSIVAKF
jgi:putative salt-induced outer membrane protein